MSKRHQQNHEYEQDREVAELMKQMHRPLSEQAEKASLEAMASGVSEARAEHASISKWQQRKTMFMGIGGTVTAAALGGLILINTDFVQDAFPGWFGDGTVPVNEENEEENENNDETDNEQNDENQEEPVEESDPEDISFQMIDDEEADEQNRLFELTVGEDTWQEWFTRTDANQIQLTAFTPEDWDVNEEQVEGDLTRDRVSLDGRVLFDYLPSGADGDDVATVIDDILQENGLDDEERVTLSEEEVSDYSVFGHHDPYDIAGGYVAADDDGKQLTVFHGEFLGRELIITSITDENHPETALYQEAVLAHTAVPFPATVHEEDRPEDEATGRMEEKTVLSPTADSPIATDVVLFRDEELGFSTYISADFSVSEDRDGQVKQYLLDEQDDPAGQISIGIFDEGVTQGEAWTYILDHYAYGENMRDETDANRIPDWAVDVFENRTNENAEMVGSVRLGERNGRYFYIERHSESWETAAHSHSRMTSIIEDFWQWEDGDQLTDEG
ncbi:hypothetical protein [Salisediminibacterium beveridgei]|uniref:Uncharacterized protein n=1 Tax=Salisediminibacterium beveridgei TaxID=632773 RepID=A0A1D7QZG1_9BACI|nr:hypothetical protein [Salisediminibacterium beveridgei]AOM84395.1 hypothetical protein BBEV_3078 [Salisediminibacterium beveridgei]